MISVSVQTKNMDKILAKMAEIGKTMPEKMYALLFTYRNRMAKSSQEDFLSHRSATTLGVVTGRLRGSIQRGSTIAKDDDHNMQIILGTNVVYAPPWEYGFHGTVQIPAHSRKVKSRNIKSRGKLLARGVAFVRGYSMKVDHDARPFLKPAAEKYLPELKKDLGNWRTYGEQ